MKNCILNYKTKKEKLQLFLGKSQSSVSLMMLKYIKFYIFEARKYIRNLSGKDLSSDVYNSSVSDVVLPL